MPEKGVIYERTNKKPNKTPTDNPSHKSSKK